jgi:hypothetical protein
VDEDAAHVAAHEAVPLLVSRVEDPLQEEVRGVVDQHVQPAEPLVRGLHDSFGDLRLGDVADDRDDAVLLELPHRGVDVLCDDGRTRVPQRRDGRPPDAAGRAGDDRGPAHKIDLDAHGLSVL